MKEKNYSEDLFNLKDKKKNVGWLRYDVDLLLNLLDYNPQHRRLFVLLL